MTPSFFLDRAPTSPTRSKERAPVITPGGDPDEPRRMNRYLQWPVACARELRHSERLVGSRSPGACGILLLMIGAGVSLSQIRPGRAAQGFGTKDEANHAWMMVSHRACHDSISFLSSEFFHVN